MAVAICVKRVLLILGSVTLPLVVVVQRDLLIHLGAQFSWNRVGNTGKQATSDITPTSEPSHSVWKEHSLADAVHKKNKADEEAAGKTTAEKNAGVAALGSSQTKAAKPSAPTTTTTQLRSYHTESSCEFDVSFPDPFSASFISSLYSPNVPESFKTHYVPEIITKFWRDMSSDLRNVMRDCERQRAFKSLLDDGLVVRSHGLDFSQVQAKRYGIPTIDGDELSKDADVLKLFDVYFATRVNRFQFQVDMPNYYRPPVLLPNSLTELERSLLEAFHRDGFVQVHNIEGLDISTLAENWESHTGSTSKASPKRKRVGAPVWKFGSQDDSKFEGVLRHGSLIRKLVHGYLRARKVIYHGIKYLMVPEQTNKTDYIAHNFHHDGCGQRIKFFVYLQDVDEATRPTMLVAGTQRMTWYPTTQFFAGHHQGVNMLNPDTVQAEYGTRINKMVGKKGSGFLFDTNLMHGAYFHDPFWGKRRDVFVFEFAAEEHDRRMPRKKPRGPDDKYRSNFDKAYCPSASHRLMEHWEL